MEEFGENSPANITVNIGSEHNEGGNTGKEGRHPWETGETFYCKHKDGVYCSNLPYIL